MNIDLRQNREEYRWLAALVAITVATALPAVWIAHLEGLSAPSLILHQNRFIWTAGPTPVFLLAVGLVVGLLVCGLGGRAKLTERLKSRFNSPALIVAAIAPIALLQVLIGAFGVLKMLMPKMRPFVWDDAFAEAGRLMTFGYRPWEITHGIFGSPMATRVIDSLYASWIALLFPTVIFFAFFSSKYDRARFFLAFASAWLLIGVAGAYVFSSAGPCYAAMIGADAAPGFAPLMERLRVLDAQQPLIAVQLQNMLWDAHMNREYALGLGISAMPSMHNALALLYLLALWRVGPWVRLLTAFFVAAIFVGSIHLGWHYAADGIVAFVMMWAIWEAVGRYLKWCGYTAHYANHSQSSEDRLPAALFPAPEGTGTAA